MKVKIFKLIDITMLICALLLTATGICFIYSSAINQQGQLVTNEYTKQIVWASLGLVLMVGPTDSYANFWKDGQRREKLAGRWLFWNPAGGIWKNHLHTFFGLVLS